MNPRRQSNVASARTVSASGSEEVVCDGQREHGDRGSPLLGGRARPLGVLLSGDELAARIALLDQPVRVDLVAVEIVRARDDRALEIGVARIPGHDATG